MNRSDFSRQLALAHERTRTLPDWAKREAGLNMNDTELEKRMEQRQAHDEARAACGCPPRRCLMCGAREPCMTEADLDPNIPAGVPCTFDPTYQDLVKMLHGKDDQIRALIALYEEKEAERAALWDLWEQKEADALRLDWLSRPENVDVEFCFCQAGYHVQQAQRIADTDRFEEVLLTRRDWPTLREALDEAIEREGKAK